MKNVAELIRDFCENEGHDYRGDYSGRFMYGRTCVGVVTDENVIALTVALFRHLIDEGMDADIVEDLLKDARTDNMGLSMIVYWPNIQE